MVAVLVAGGPGRRLGAKIPKAFVRVAGVPLFLRSLRALLGCGSITAVVVVVPRGYEQHAARVLNTNGPWACRIIVVAGGKERQDSVRNGLTAAASSALVLIHDAARPFVSTEAITRCIAGARKHGAAILALQATDTIKEVDERSRVVATPVRERLWLAQTPQAFRTELLIEAHDAAVREGINGTDDSALVERLGKTVVVVPGDPDNRKITTPEDLSWAKWRALR